MREGVKGMSVRARRTTGVSGGGGGSGRELGCPHSWLRLGGLSLGVWLGSGGPFKGRRGALPRDLCHPPLAKDQSGSKRGLASE